jgi:hypothetical protein
VTLLSNFTERLAGKNVDASGPRSLNCHPCGDSVKAVYRNVAVGSRARLTRSECRKKHYLILSVPVVVHQVLTRSSTRLAKRWQSLRDGFKRCRFKCP